LAIRSWKTCKQTSDQSREYRWKDESVKLRKCFGIQSPRTGRVTAVLWIRISGSVRTPTPEANRGKRGAQSCIFQWNSYDNTSYPLNSSEGGRNVSSQ
jgi:hypothetical protein